MQIIYLTIRNIRNLCKGFLDNVSVKDLRFSFLTRHNLHDILYLQ